MGLFESDLSPTSVAFMPCPARSPVRSRIVVPEFPQSRAILGSRKLPPCIVISFPFLLISIPQFLRQEIVEETSLPVERFINFHKKKLR